jgi:hypothetical protein
VGRNPPRALSFLEVEILVRMMHYYAEPQHRLWLSRN